MNIEVLTCGPFMTNTYLISNGDDAIIIDPTMNLERKSHIYKKYNIKAVLLTHGHIDHIAGVNLFDTPIYISRYEKDFLYDNELNLSSQFGFLFTKPNQEIMYVNNGSKLNLIGLDIDVLHTPGHTKGSVCYKIGNNLFSGDTLFQMSMGRVDFPTGSSEKMYDSLIKLIDNLDEKMVVYPGHGCETTIGLEKHNPYYKMAKQTK